MKRILRVLGLSVLVLWTAVLHHYHMGVLPPPQVAENEHGEGLWISRTTAGVNHMILKGTPYTRGLKAGEMTRGLLDLQEQSLISHLNAWIPSHAVLQVGVFGLIAYFKGGEKYIEPNDLLEMYGTSKSAPHRFDYLADGYTRQLAYHGLHEVGQMMVDSGVDMGCTVAAVPHEKGWILGRNFDFEGGRVFDTEKIVKWVFPDGELAHVSVTWAGMVGSVTGINEKGVYISINAAGSEGYRRLGTPSTLVLYKVLREAKNTEDAIRIIRDSQMFITDIFVIMDAAGRLVRIEKSPQKIAVIEAAVPFVVANHLVGKEYEGDKTNEFRKRELTSVARETRAKELVQKIPARASAAQKTQKILEVLRDKGRDEQGRPLPPGHHLAIDSLIATHSVIVDSTRGRLYVSKGPSLTGEFLGYDLEKSFHEQKPVLVEKLPKDPQISTVFYEQFKDAAQTVTTAKRMVRAKKCDEALDKLEGIQASVRNQGPYYHALGDVHACLNQTDAARDAWRRAYAMKPAYAHWRKDLEKKLTGILGEDLELQ